MVFIGWYRCTRVRNGHWNLEVRIVSSYLKTRDSLAVDECLLTSDSAQVEATLVVYLRQVHRRFLSE